VVGGVTTTTPCTRRDPLQAIQTAHAMATKPASLVRRYAVERAQRSFDRKPVAREPAAASSDRRRRRDVRQCSTLCWRCRAGWGLRHTTEAPLSPVDDSEVWDLCGVRPLTGRFVPQRHLGRDVGHALSTKRTARSEGPFEFGQASRSPGDVPDHLPGRGGCLLVANKPTQYTAEDERPGPIAELVAPIWRARLVRSEAARRYDAGRLSGAPSPIWNGATRTGRAGIGGRARPS
jgi:hypothetical protein